MESVANAIRKCANEVAAYVAANAGNPMPARKEILASVRTLLKRPDLLDIGLNRPAVNADSSRILYYDPSIMFVLGYSAEAGRYDPPPVSYTHLTLPTIYSV